MEKFPPHGHILAEHDDHGWDFGVLYFESNSPYEVLLNVLVLSLVEDFAAFQVR